MICGGTTINDDILVTAMGAGSDFLDIIERLLKAGANRNAVHSYWKKTPLKLAEEKGNNELIKLFIQYGSK